VVHLCVSESVPEEMQKCDNKTCAVHTICKLLRPIYKTRFSCLVIANGPMTSEQMEARVILPECKNCDKKWVERIWLPRTSCLIHSSNPCGLRSAAALILRSTAQV